MRILIAGLLMCVAGCSSSYDNGPLGYSKRGPIERAEPDADHSSLNADNQRQGAATPECRVQRAYNPDARPVPIGVVAARRVRRARPPPGRFASRRIRAGAAETVRFNAGNDHGWTCLRRTGRVSVARPAALTL